MEGEGKGDGSPTCRPESRQRLGRKSPQCRWRFCGKSREFAQRRVRRCRCKRTFSNCFFWFCSVGRVFSFSFLFQLLANPPPSAPSRLITPVCRVARRRQKCRVRIAKQKTPPHLGSLAADGGRHASGGCDQSIRESFGRVHRTFSQFASRFNQIPVFDDGVVIRLVRLLVSGVLEVSRVESLIGCIILCLCRQSVLSRRGQMSVVNLAAGKPPQLTSFKLFLISRDND